METALNIFEVLTAVATLIVIVIAGVILAYFVAVLRLVHDLLERIRHLVDSLRGGAKQAIDTAKQNPGALLRAAGLISAFIIARMRKWKK